MKVMLEKKKHKITVSVVILLLSTVLLSACTNPAESDKDPISLTSSNKKVLSDTSVNANQANNSKTKLTNELNTNTTNQQKGEQPTMKEYKELADFKEIEATQAVFETTKGTLVMDLYREKAPLTTANFLDLIDSGFYDGIIFHRVIPGFMAQVGDPFTKDRPEQFWGMGGPEYRIKDEFHPDLTHDDAGILSMANSGPDTGGSQIFITYEAQPHLDGKHAVFGKLVEGMDILESIEKGDKIISASYR